MKKRILSFLLSLAIVGGATTCVAVDSGEPAPQASLYLDGYGIGISPKGGCLLAITYIVYGTGTMDRIGAQRIEVEEWDGAEWSVAGTFTVSKNPDFYASNASEHAGTAYLYGTPGLQYRATLTAYAERDGGSDTGTVTSLIKTCT